jgi:Na+/H+ antiporter NhaA
VSLFIGDLAYDDPRLEDAARLAILATSAVAAVVGSAILALGSQSGRTREPPAEPAA